MAKKIYAVKVGRTNGIFETWDECKASVNGYPGALYKSFTNMADAYAYLNLESKQMSLFDMPSDDSVDDSDFPVIKESVEEIMNEWNSQALREYKENVVLKPFVKEYLRELKDRGYKIGLATAALHDYYIPVLEREGVLDCFDVFTDTRDDARDKNFPDIYLLCAEKLGSNSANSIVFEDVLKGVKSSVSAGFNTTAVYDNQPENQWEIIKNTANRHIMDFSELLHKK